MSQGAHASAGDKGPSAQPPLVLAAVLRMDLKLLGGLTDKDERAFLARMALLRGQVKVYPSCLGKEGGEGDSIRQAFTDVRDALQCAFYLRHAAQQPIEGKDGPYILEPRIVLHFAEFRRSEGDRIEGLGQILVTRLDHAVPPGEIWATEAFADIARHVGADKGYSFEYVGQRELAKQSGKHPCYAVELTSRTITSDSLHRPSDPVELAMRLFDQGDQAEAVTALGTINSELASRHLMDIALKPEVDRRVRHSALARLQERGSDIDIQRIRDAFTNESSVETGALLLFALGATGSEEIIGTLSNVITKKSPSMPIRLREAALIAMRNLGGSLAAEAVQIALNDSEDLVRIAACVAAASGRMPIGVQTHLGKIAGDDELPMDLRSVACEALSMQQITKKLIEILEVLVLNRELSPTLRRYALNGLEQSDDPVAVRAVEEIARRTDDLRIDAISVLAAMRAPRRERYRRPRQRVSSIAEVIELRTRPQEDADGADAL